MPASRSAIASAGLCLVAAAVTACGGGGTIDTTPGGGPGGTTAAGGGPAAGGSVPSRVAASGVEVRTLTCDSTVPRAQVQAAITPLVPDATITEITTADSGGSELKCEIHFPSVSRQAGVTPTTGTLGIDVTVDDTFDEAYGHDGSLEKFREERADRQTGATPGPAYDQLFANAPGLGEEAFIEDTIYHGSDNEGRRSVLYVHRATAPYFLRIFLSRGTFPGDPLLDDAHRREVAVAAAKVVLATLPS